MFHCTVHLKGASTGQERYICDAVAVRHCVYSFGGYSNTNNRDQIGVYIFNTLSLRWKKLPPVTNRGGKRHPEVPSSRSGHTAVLIEDVAYIWGGGDLSCNSLYGFDVNTHSWFKPNMYGTVPEARYCHSACVLGKVMYIYGGCRGDLMIYNDFYTLDTNTIVWTLINSGYSSARAWHSATLIKTKIFVFGGVGEHKINEVSVFDTETNRWLSAPSAQLNPGRIWGHTAVAYNGELYIFGGSNWKQCFNDLWKFNPETFSWKKVELKGKSPSQMKRMCLCMVGDCIIIFGGYRGSTPVDDLYILDASPSLKSLCKLAVIQCGLEQSELPHEIRWELAREESNKKTLMSLCNCQ